MGRRVLPLFLTALLLFGITDDLFASFTTDPQDDVLAAANNTYLSARAAHDQMRQQHGHRPSPAGLPAAAIPAVVPRQALQAGRTASPTGADPLDRLLSLRL